MPHQWVVNLMLQLGIDKALLLLTNPLALATTFIGSQDLNWRGRQLVGELVLRESPKAGSSLWLVGAVDLFELVGIESPMELVGTESPLELVGTKSSLELVETESPLELVGTQSLLKLVGIESPLELVGTQSLLKLVGTESSLEVVAREVPWAFQATSS
ncbi:hypothetical protein GW17_00024594 [Ensete ventricosum]|nr:hypothetical protein GW17_00024594 [Ensete ventricosum]